MWGEAHGTGPGEPLTALPYPPSCTWSKARPVLKPVAMRPILGRKREHQQESRVVSVPSSWDPEAREAVSTAPLLACSSRKQKVTQEAGAVG